MNSSISYLLVKKQSAAKTGMHAKGSLSYAIIRDDAASEAFVCLLGNDGAGFFSPEAIPFSAIERCLEGVTPEKPISAKLFRMAFRSKSANNPGFLAAVLRAEGLLVAAPEATHQHRLGGDWSAWRKDVLAQAGEPFELPEVTKAKAKAAAAITHADETPAPEEVKGRKSRKAPAAKRQLPSVAAESDSHAHPA